MTQKDDEQTKQMQENLRKGLKALKSGGRKAAALTLPARQKKS